MKVVLIGAGFAGLKIARTFNNQKGIELLLLDKYNYHQFQPLFYQVATAGLDASNISFPLRKVFQNSSNIHIRMANVLSVDTHLKKVHTDIGNFHYDKLIIATGADTNFFGNKKIQEAALPMKSTVEALQLRHRFLHNLEEALQITDRAILAKLLTVVVVGGGPTGVELCGALAEMRNLILPKDYPELDFSLMKIFLIENNVHTLAAMFEKSRIQSEQYLKKLGVDVLTGISVSDYDGGTVVLNNGNSIASNTLIWAAGIKGNVPTGLDESLIVHGNRIKVNRLNEVIGVPDIYAVGDVAYMETPLYPHGHPQVANVAITQGLQLAKNLLHPGNPQPYEYHDKGSMATVGRNLAVVDIPKPRLHFGGFLAWLVWMGLHLFLLVGVKNRIQVFINWIYNYFTKDPNLRLIFREFYKPKHPIHVTTSSVTTTSTEI
ncbi:MAG: FAD-dependent oxidoreductase [Hydrotalea flava]|nr:FAD-dependent oxidoreductase [Hydrotalea flava]GHU81451.1 NADH dehydrogenase [Spirochaetia bacterium]NIM38191.1 FAD-dependent oxidoreductase [Hydrotalea flava]NIN03355.1 FAD-dependent oxidoreductase [Hydrotalea flava]NIN15049.1 FAD-dependent oxidoreductase [Hydrotalea flava]